MPISSKIRVLLIDDSLLFREGMKRALESDEWIEVIGTAADVYTGRDLIEEHDPDVVTLDIEMPRMDGIEFLRRLLPQHPVPVVVVSSVGNRVFDALAAGAVDFVSKPAAACGGGLDRLVSELLIKIKVASTARISQPGRSKGQLKDNRRLARGDSDRRPVDLIAIGASTGGTEAVSRVLRGWPADMPPIMIVQHMPPVFTRLYADRLNRECRMTVIEAGERQVLRPGLAVLAAGDRHLSLSRERRELIAVSHSGERVSGHCPSVDVLFDSISRMGSLNAIGIILTGMGHDGARGLLAMKRSGAFTIGQDEQSSVVYGMPKVAYSLGAIRWQAPVDQIADLVLSLVREPDLSHSGARHQDTGL